MQNGYSFKDGGLDKSTAISMKIREEAASRLSELKQDKINKRQEAASRLLNDQSLRTLAHDTTKFRAKGVDRSQRDDYFGLADPVTFQANKLMNQTQRNQGVVQNVAGATNDRLNKLKVSQSVNIFKPITDKEFLPMIKPLPSADAEVLREELDRLQNESLMIERQRELRLQQMMANQPATEPINPQRPLGGGFAPPGVPQPQRMMEPPSTDRGSQRSIMTNPMARSFHQLRGERGVMGGNGPPTRSVNFDPKFQRLNDEKLQQLRERDQLEAMIQEKEFFMQQARRQQMARNPPQMIRPPMLDPRQVGVNRVGVFPPGANPNRKPNLVQNSNRNPDLNDFERALLFEEAKELDNVRLLKKLPVGTDLYRFKMEQFKETSTAGGEIEKLVYEQMLKAVKKGQDIQAREAERYVEDLIWDDEQRKNLLAGYIRKQLTLGTNLEYQGPADSDTSSEEAEAPPMRFPTREMKYDPTEGFNVYWDYILGMEAFQRYTGFEYQIVCNGDNIKNLEQSTDLTPNIETSDNVCQTILNQRTRFKGIPVNPDMLLIWKVYQTRTENGVDEAPVEIGWTQIDLWTLTRDLKRGVWKCPIYKLPYDPYITKEGIKKLTPIPGAWYHLRIAYPFMDEFNNMSLNPEESRSLAEIPEIHLRAAQFQPPEPVIAPVIEIPAQRPPDLNPNTLDRPDDKDKDEFIPPPDPSSNRPPPEPPKVGDRVGVTVDINRVNRHQAQSHMRISVICLEGNIPVKDDTMKKWERLTMIHNPLISGEDDNEALGTAVVASQLVKEGKMANLSKGADIVFRKDTFNLFRNLRAMMQASGKPVYLIFKLLEKPRPKDVLKGTNKGYDAETEANLGGLQYNTIGYSVFQLSNEKMNLKEGKFIINFLKPPVKNPPFEEGRVPKMDDECQVEFQIALRPYTEKDVDEEYKKLTGQLKKTIAADNASIAGSTTKKSQAVITNEPFIENAKRQYPDKIFEKGYGIDFYLDGCRFLPDNVSVTKCIIRVVNQNYKDIFPMKATIPRDLDDKNDAYNPIINYRYEYRAASIDPTALLFLCFVTIDTSNNESRVIGYAGLNLFVNRYSGLQPTDENDSDIFLQSGNYQLPLHPEEPLRISPFNMQRIENLDKLPCASHQSFSINHQTMPIHNRLQTQTQRCVLSDKSAAGAAVRRSENRVREERRAQSRVAGEGHLARKTRVWVRCVQHPVLQDERQREEPLQASTDQSSCQSCSESR